MKEINNAGAAAIPDPLPTSDEIAARLLSKAVKGAWDAIRECIPDMTDTEFESVVLATTADIADEAVKKELKKRGYRIPQATNDASDIEKNGQHYMHGIL